MSRAPDEAGSTPQTQEQAQEQARLAALHHFDIMDTPAEPAFDQIAQLAADHFGTPIALVAFVDSERQWFKSCIGLDLDETPRDQSFCAHAILSDEPLIILDATQDPRFADNPRVTGAPGFRFYAAAPLITPDGHRLGALAVIDTVPRQDFSQIDRRALVNLAAMVMREVAFRSAVQRHHAMEAALQTSEQRFRDAFENAPIGMALVSIEGRFLTVNKALCTILGFSEAELLGYNVGKLTYQEDIAPSLVGVEAQLSGKTTTFTIEKRYIRKDLTLVWVDLQTTLVRDREGQPTHFVSQVKDISKRKTAESRLEALVERHQMAVEAASVGVWETEIGSDHHIWDKEVYRQFGIPEGTGLASIDHVVSLVHPDDRAAARAALEQALVSSDGYTHEHRVIWPNGEHRHIQLHAKIIRDDAGQPTRLIGTSVDMTDYRRLIDRLDAETHALRAANRAKDQQAKTTSAISEAAAHGIITVDATGHIGLVNSSTERLFGYRREELLGQSIDLLVPDAMAKGIFAVSAACAAPPALPAAPADGRQAVGRDKAGRDIPLDIQLRALELDDEALVVATLLDLRPRLVTERALVEAKEKAELANAAKTEFLTIMSHELRTPMNGILGFGQLLDGQAFGALNPKQEEFVDAIMVSGKHLLKLIEQVLELSKIEAGKLTVSMEAVELLPIIKSVVASLGGMARQYGVEIDAGDFGLGLPLVHADRTRLAQCLSNLTSNAIKYNRPGGTVHFSYARIGEDSLRISVIDTGLGISPERFDELFLPFSRLGAEQHAIEGTGVGLAITKKLAALMGARIEVDSIQGKGSVFSIELQRYQDSTAAGLLCGPDTTQANIGRDCKLLYVEDNALNRLLIQAICTTLKTVTLIEATDAASGLAAARRERPDIILLDINLPDQNGFALLNQLRRDPSFAATPIMALSANAMPDQVRRGLSAGFFRYLSKPVVVPELVDAINDALRLYAHQAEPIASSDSPPRPDQTRPD